MFKKISLYGQIISHSELHMFLTLDIDPTTANVKTCGTNHKITQP